MFGSKNFAAVHKFLTIAWKRNELNGEADFDIDEDNQKNQLSIFEDKKMTKIEKFQSDLELKLMENDLVTNKQVLVYTYEHGHIPKHAEVVLKRLKYQGKLHYETRTPYLTYENVFRKNNIIKYGTI